MAYARLTVRRSIVGVVVVGLLVAGAVGFATRFMPQLDYLPDGNANFAFGRIFTPPGYSMDETLRIAEKMENAARPLWEKDTGGEGPPAIERFFFVAFSGGAFAGASAKDPARVSELQMVLMRPIFSEPGTGAFVRQASLFGRSVGGSRSIRIDIRGPSREAILPVAFRVNERLGELFPRTEGNQVRAFLNLDNGVRKFASHPILPPGNGRGAVRDVTSAVDVFNDGANVIQIPIAGELIDLVVFGQDASKLTAAQLGDIPIVTRSGGILRLSQLAKIEIISAPEQIRRIGGSQGNVAAAEAYGNTAAGKGG